MPNPLRPVMALTLAASLAVAGTGLALAQSTPEYKLGFKALAGQIPAVVGQPLENERYAANGDSL